MAIYHCTLCNEEVTCPYFFKDKVYGYTCIKKVNPEAEKNKKTSWFPIKSFKVHETPGSNRIVARATLMDGTLVEVIDYAGINHLYRIIQDTDQGKFVSSKAYIIRSDEFKIGTRLSDLSKKSIESLLG